VLPKISLVLVFLVMACVLVVRPHGLLGRPEGVARRTLGIAARPWRPMSNIERGLVALAIVVAAIVPAFAGNYALTVGSEIFIVCLFAASLHLIMSAGGLASFGHAAYFGLGAYGAAFAVKSAGLPMEIAILVGPLLGLAGAVLFGWFCVRLSGVYFAMLTLAFAQIAWSVAFQWVPVTGGDNGMVGVWPSSWAASPQRFYWLTLALACFGTAALRVLVFSPFGYGLRATRDSPLRAEAIGIDRARVQWVAFAIAGTFAGIAGALFVFLKGSVFPDSLGIPLSVDALVMVLLGGIETVSGAIVGAIVFKALSIWLMSQTDLSKLVLGLVIVLLVVAFPKGIVGSLEAVLAWRPRRQAPALPRASRQPSERAAARGRRAGQVVWRRSCGARRLVHARGRRGGGAHRPERGRQEHLLQHAQRPDQAR
jgi:branched-chain amino acid transport system permease protein